MDPVLATPAALCLTSTLLLHLAAEPDEPVDIVAALREAYARL